MSDASHGKKIKDFENQAVGTSNYKNLQEPEAKLALLRNSVRVRCLKAKLLDFDLRKEHSTPWSRMTVVQRTLTKFQVNSSTAPVVAEILSDYTGNSLRPI